MSSNSFTLQHTNWNLFLKNKIKKENLSVAKVYRQQPVTVGETSMVYVFPPFFKLFLEFFFNPLVLILLWIGKTHIIRQICTLCRALFVWNYQRKYLECTEPVDKRGNWWMDDEQRFPFTIFLSLCNAASCAKMMSLSTTTCLGWYSTFCTFILNFLEPSWPWESLREWEKCAVDVLMIMDWDPCKIGFGYKAWCEKRKKKKSQVQRQLKSNHPCHDRA